jgi:nucleotide-binding universal stress UspA family protein
MYKKILTVLEGKETDEAIVTHTQALATHARAEVTLLRVITVADDGGGGLGLQFQTEIGSSGWRRMNQAKTLLPQMERRLRNAGLCVETALVVSTQSEAEAIAHYAAENDCDLIAMACDARPWYKRWFGGNLANRVLRKATVPTLIVGDGARTAPEKRTSPETNRVMELFGNASL